jgi:hypothetical protein
VENLTDIQGSLLIFNIGQLLTLHFLVSMNEAHDFGLNFLAEELSEK